MVLGLLMVFLIIWGKVCKQGTEIPQAKDISSVERNGAPDIQKGCVFGNKDALETEKECKNDEKSSSLSREAIRVLQQAHTGQRWKSVMNLHLEVSTAR